MLGGIENANSKRGLVRNVKKRVFLFSRARGPNATRRWQGMSECQTFPSLEKKSGAFCFLRSEKRPVKQTGSPMGTDPRNGNLSSGIPVRCFLPVPSWYGTTCWGITLLDMAVTHAYWCHSSIVDSVALLSTLRRLASRAVAAAVPASLHLCLRRCGDTSACCCGTGNPIRLVYHRTFLVHSQTP